MKFRISLFLFALALIASLTVTTHASACNNITIKGRYASTIHGTVFTPDGSTLLITGLSLATYDGEGNLTQLDAVSANGNVPPGWRVSTGTYSVNRDCTGTMTVTNDPFPPVHVQFVVSESGNKMRVMAIDPGFATTGEGERIRTPKK